MHSTIRTHYRRLPYLLTTLTVVAVLWLTLSPDPTGGTHLHLFKNQDKVAHALMFGCICAVYYADRSLLGRPCSRLGAWWWCLGTILFGGAIEVVQELLTASRSGEWADWLADTVGCLFAWGCYCLLVRRRGAADS